MSRHSSVMAVKRAIGGGESFHGRVDAIVETRENLTPIVVYLQASHTTSVMRRWMYPLIGTMTEGKRAIRYLACILDTTPIFRNFLLMAIIFAGKMEKTGLWFALTAIENIEIITLKCFRTDRKNRVPFPG